MKNLVQIVALLSALLLLTSCSEMAKPVVNITSEMSSSKYLGSSNSSTTEQSRTESDPDSTSAKSNPPSSELPKSSDAELNVSGANDYVNAKWMIQFRPNKVTVKVGEGTPINSILSPLGYTTGHATFTYKISDTSIADFNSSSRSVRYNYIKAKKVGTCTFTITGKADNGQTFSDTCTITVTK